MSFRTLVTAAAVAFTGAIAVALPTAASAQIPGPPFGGVSYGEPGAYPTARGDAYGYVPEGAYGYVAGDAYGYNPDNTAPRGYYGYAPAPDWGYAERPATRRHRHWK
jgi:hypothetical protein